MHILVHVSCHKEWLSQSTLCFQIHLDNYNNIIIDVKNKKLVNSITVTAVKKERRQVNKKLHKISRKGIA